MEPRLPPVPQKSHSSGTSRALGRVIPLSSPSTTQLRAPPLRSPRPVVARRNAYKKHVTIAPATVTGEPASAVVDEQVLEQREAQPPAPPTAVARAAARWRVLEATTLMLGRELVDLAVGQVLDPSSYGAERIAILRTQNVQMEPIE